MRAVLALVIWFGSPEDDKNKIPAYKNITTIVAAKMGHTKLLIAFVNMSETYIIVKN